MQVSITGRHLDISSSLRERVEEGIAKMIVKYFGHAQDVSATFDKENHDFKATLLVHVGKGMSYHAVGVARDAYASAEKAMEHLAKQLRRDKRRIREEHPSKLQFD